MAQNKIVWTIIIIQEQICCDYTYLLYYRPDLFLLLSHRSPGCSGKPKQTNIYNNNNICGSWLQSLIWSIWKYVVLEIKSIDWPLINKKLFVLENIPTDLSIINLKIFCIGNYINWLTSIQFEIICIENYTNWLASNQFENILYCKLYEIMGSDH